ncbi:hypothetical protein [Bosea sp. ASV33]|uniref:hypothetical protein n=1 Tax=Bosea sp. ASV33 TaxID=2795106 RepID=UPI0018EB4415|nr:hypothetical protein [Bosea sp. ASV33]
MDDGTGNDEGDADSKERLNKISEHVVEACYLAHEHGADLLAHLLKMALAELESLGAYR